MAKHLGNTKKVYMTTAKVTALSGVQSSDMLAGETSNTLNYNGNLVETSDKSTIWQEWLPGIKGGSLSVVVHEDTANAKQQALLAAIKAGTLLHCFVGDATNGGEAFDAYVASISQPSENAAVASWNIELTINGEPTTVNA